MKFSTILLFIFFFSLNVNSQIQSINAETSQLVTLGFSRELDVNSKTNIEGSPYLIEVFFDANVSISDTIIKVPVRYNVALDEMEFKRDDKIFALVANESITVDMLLSKKTYHYVEYNLEDSTKKGFLVKKSNNKNINLYVKERIVNVPYKEALNPYSQPTPAHYEQKSPVFLIEFKNNIQEMPKNKKELMTIFPENKNEIQNFIKSNNTNFKKEEDLIVLIQFLDTL